MSALDDPEDSPPNAFSQTDRPVPAIQHAPSGYETEGDIRERRTALTEVGKFRVELGEVKEIVERIANQLEIQGQENGRSKSVESAILLEIASLRGLQPNGLAGKRVLVVDDHDDFLNTCERVLGELGCNVTAASDALEAERVLAANPRRPPHIALVDLHLPKVTKGLDLMRWILSAYPEVRVIAVSGYFDAAPEIADLPVARVEKPFTLDRIRAAMYGVLGMVDSTCQTEPPPPPSTVAPPRRPSAVVFVDPDDDTQPSINVTDVDLPSTGRETPDAKRTE